MVSVKKLLAVAAVGISTGLVAPMASAEIQKMDFKVVGTWHNLPPGYMFEKPFWDEQVSKLSGGKSTGKKARKRFRDREDDVRTGGIAVRRSCVCGASARSHTRMRTHTHAHAHTHTLVCVRARVRAHTHTSIRTHVCACVCTCAHTQTHTHTHTHTHAHA